MIEKIGLFTSGGDAPGMNAAIRAVVRTSIAKKIIPMGIMRGYKGMIESQIKELSSKYVSNIIQRGGTRLKSSRSQEFQTPQGREIAFKNLRKHQIDGLVAMGGNGTFTGADIFSKEYDIPVIGIPATIDNDLYGTDYTLGFDTAVNNALSCIDKIRETASSHERAFFIEVMGRNTGFIAAQTGLGCGAEMIIIPEKKITLDDIKRVLNQNRKHSKTSFIIIVAEGNTLGNVNQIGEDVKKILPNLGVRVTSLGHIQRGGQPTVRDRILGSLMGIGAIEGLLSGKKSEMVGIINNKVTFTPLEKAIKEKKEISFDIIKTLKLLNN